MLTAGLRARPFSSILSLSLRYKLLHINVSNNHSH